MAERIIGFDLDGVLARPATYFVNFAAMSSRLSTPGKAWTPPEPGITDIFRGIFSKTPVRDEGEIEPESPADKGVSPLRRATETVRYAMRFPMPDAEEILRGLQPLARLVLVTNRNNANRDRLERWLSDKGLRSYLESVHLNDTGEPGTHFKLGKLRQLGVDEYVEDNPEICDFLARSGIRVYFRKWAGVREPFEPSVVTYRTADELIAAVGRPALR
jgi:phosphoglycolate phosphatase-like HAD superfamily hydrolase